MKGLAVFLAVASLCAGLRAGAVPVVFHVSDPVGPDETVIVHGDGLAGATGIEIARLSDSARAVTLPRKPGRVAVLQPSATSVKFTVPATLKPGLFAFRVLTADGATAPVLLNRPQAWWVQGDLGHDASPGGSVRIFGKCLALPGGKAARIELAGPQRRSLEVTGAGRFQLFASLPQDLPTGAYTVRVHPGSGGEPGWSAPLQVAVRSPQPWPDTLFSVKDFSASGEGSKDDTVALQAALTAAGANGGGIVYLPRGRYQINATLTVPRFTELRGERTDLVCLLWPDTATPPEALLRGTNSFAVTDVTLYSSHYVHGIVGDLGDQAGAGNVRLLRVRTRLNRYRGHLTPEEADKRFRDTARQQQGDTVRLGGDDLEIVGCDLYGSGRALYLSRVRCGRVIDNALYNGRGGGTCISGSDGLIFENNRIVGADLMATGGGINCRDGSSFSQNVFYAHNQLRLMHGWDREAMTSDAGGGAYLGKATLAGPTTLTLADEPSLGDRNWAGAGVYIMAGTGQLQHRRVVKAAERTVEVDRPWDVTPDDTSVFSLSMRQEHYLIVDNDFVDAGIAVQFYGISIEHLIVGNRAARAGGFQNIGKLYSGRYDLPPERNLGHQPSWFCQFLGNEITEGNIYRSGANTSTLAGDSVVGVFGWPPTPDWPWPYNVGTVVRRNRLANNARIHLGGSANDLPAVRDVVVEDNLIANADTGIQIDRATAGILLRNNRFEGVGNPLNGTGLATAWLAPEQRLEADRSRCRVLAAEAGLPDDEALWAEVEAALAQQAKAEAGSPASAAAVGTVLARLATRGVDYPWRTVGTRLGLTLAVAPESTLPQILQADNGGPATLVVVLTSPCPWPWKVAATVNWPAGWTGTAEAAPQVLGVSTKLTLAVMVPPGTWGCRELPVTITLALPERELRLTEPVRVGVGFLRDWMLVGPFPNRTKYPLDLTLYPPDDGPDLAAEYDGATGKVRWTPVATGDAWVDLAAQFQAQGPGVAYALAGFSAERETPVLLRLGSSGGVSLVLNREAVWSSNTSRTAAPDQDRVPLTLRAGDNVLLFKISTATAAWRFTAELTPAPGGSVAGVAPIPVEAFASRPVFAPPPRRAPTTTAGVVQHAAGVDWRLLYADDFPGTQLGPRWRAAVGRWEVHDSMVTSGLDRAFLAYAEALPAPLRIEYEARGVDATVGDLSAFWLRDPADYGSGLLVGFGSNGNTLNKVLLDGAQLAGAARPLVQPGTWHHVIVQVLANGHVQLIVDGQLALDRAGVPCSQALQPGLWTWGAAGAFRNVRLYGAVTPP
jgi:hypothetical protein